MEATYLPDYFRYVEKKETVHRMYRNKRPLQHIVEDTGLLVETVNKLIESFLQRTTPLRGRWLWSSGFGSRVPFRVPDNLRT